MTVALVANIARPISSAISTAFAMDNYGKLNDYGKLGAWSPLSLFAASEVGVFYDPSDLSTMFQDSAGTTSVTADGQSVGLILDKSKGLVLGPELVTTAFIPYTGNGTVSEAGGITTATCTTNGVYGLRLDSNICVGGGAYELTFEIVTNSAAKNINVYPNLTHSGIIIGAATGNKSYVTVTPTASGSSANLSFILVGGLVGESFSVRLVSMKVLSGNHGIQSTAAARPAYKITPSRIDYDAVDDVLNITFPSSLGSSCTVCRANVGGAPTILTGQTIGTSYADSTDNAGLIIINRALTGQETTDVTAWLTAKGAT